MRYFFCVLSIVVTGFALYGLQQESVRIVHIEVLGANPALAEIASSAMQGRYLGIIPRDSVLFFPSGRIRADILATDSNISTVSMSRKGLTGLSIKVNVRVPIARWCGSIPKLRSDLSSSSPRSDLVNECYVFDDSGFIFATTSDVQLVNTFEFYTPLSLATGTPDTSSPIGMQIPRAQTLPATFNFARQLTTLGSPVSRVVLRDEEVDNYLVSGTRITYVLGNEQNAFTALVSAKASLNLADGSLDYVDLRFNGKVYLKKKGVSVVE